MDIQEIQLLQLQNNFLLSPAEGKAVVQGLCGLQAQFFPNACHALDIRSINGAETLPHLVKNWTLRGTMHLFHEADLPLFLAHCGPLYRLNAWTEKSWWNQRPGWALSPERQAYFTSLLLDALENGPLTREEMKLLCREKGMTEGEENSLFDPWGGGIREMCERGFMHYLPKEEKTFALTPLVQPLPPAEAEKELARRYFSCYGPSTLHDIMYFFHIPKKQAEKRMAALPLSCAACQGQTYFYLESALPLPEKMPSCLFLAGFDPLLLGHEKKESLFLPPEHVRKIFNLSGIVMPSLLVDGRIRGQWKEKGGKLHIALFEKLTKKQRSSLEEAAFARWGHGIKIQYDA